VKTLRLVFAVTALAGLMVAVAASRPDRGTEPAPTWIPTSVACPSYPLAHVSHRERIDVIRRCATVRGTVRRVAYVPHNGNYKLLVAIEHRYRKLLKEGNHGLLPVEIIPTDQRVLVIPKAGQRATFYGSWVHEGAHVALHPAWAVRIRGKLRTRETTPTLRLHTDLPRSVALGEPIPVVANVRSATSGRLKPVSQAHLFAELLPARGPAVDWAAASTNTLGFARLSFTALERPGAYRLRLYALKGSERGRLEFDIKIRRR
jgi:hypothetical protein